MFASQLLRILQTIPSDVKYENCVYDSVEQDMTMKENQNPTLYDSRSFGREADSLPFGSKDVYQLNGLRKDSHPLVFDVNNRDECWNATFTDDFSMDNQNGNGVLSHPSSLDEDSDSLSSDTDDKDKEQSTPEHESSTRVEEFTHCNENESVPASGLFQTDTHLYTDKNVAEFEQPELKVCYKEINYHVAKDICIDEGMKLSHSKDDQSGHSCHQSLKDNSHCEALDVAADVELYTSDGSAALQLGDRNGVSPDENGCKNKSPKPISPSESSSENGTAEHCGTEDSMQKDETNGATAKTVAVASEEASFVDRTLPIQEFGTRSFLRSFLNSLDGEGDNVIAQLPDQISSGKPVRPAVSSAESGQKEDVQESILYYNSQVERGTITFNFNSPAPLVADTTNGRTKNSRDVLDHKNADSDKLSDTTQVHCNNNNGTTTGKVDEQSLNIKNASSNDLSQAECVSSKEMNDKDVRDQSLKDKDENSNKFTSDSQVVESHVLNLEQGKYDEGEASFSADGLITYSGPISYSGSISLRSDGSATSGRSFAFPILQSEWNSSPVRMTKGDGRHFRKHKGWRSGLLCCRF